MKYIQTASFLLIIILAGCGGALGGDTPRSAVPTELVGTWSNGGVADTSYYDPATGSWGAPSGTGSAYTFTSDGSFIFYQLTQVTFYGCTTSVFGYYTGTMTIEGNALTLYNNQGTVRYEDTCNETYEKPIDPSTYPYTYSIGNDESGNTILTTIWTDGSQTEYRKQ